MKPIKNILLPLIVMLVLSPVQGQDIEEYILKDLHVIGSDQIGHIQDGETDIEVRISSNYESSTSGFFIPCLGSMGSEYGSLRLGSEGYIDVINNSGSAIYSIEYVGCSTSQADPSNCLAGVSTDGINYSAYYKEKNKPATNITSGLSFSGDTEEACRGYEILIPDIVYSGLGGSVQELTGFQRQVKTVRLIWTSGVFGGKSNSSMGEVPEFYGFKIRTVKDGSVGLAEENEAESSPSTRYQVIISREMDGSYRLSKESDIRVYDLSGRLILQKSQAESFDLSAQAEGVYIVTGRDLNTNRIFQEKLIR